MTDDELRRELDQEVNWEERSLEFWREQARVQEGTFSASTVESILKWHEAQLAKLRAALESLGGT